MTDVIPEFSERQDEGPATAFFGPGRFVTHIDEGAMAAGGSLYTERWCRQVGVVDPLR